MSRVNWVEALLDDDDDVELAPRLPQAALAATLPPPKRGKPRGDEGTRGTERERPGREGPAWRGQRPAKRAGLRRG